ncbi:uncharacterized protein LOC142628565 [Castanea sativa]|uniref:uncharacterized protein LOC142628565 n=1 Tax=Castanea sativa TaxID=21020 RepID=UPI003F64FBEB
MNEDEVQDPEGSQGKDSSRRTKQSDEASNDLLRSMRKEMDELKNAMKGKIAKNLDRMVRRTDSPFTQKVLDYPLRPIFQLPQLDSNDGLKDPLDHTITFKMTLSLQETPNEIVCRSFPTTLKEAARVWEVLEVDEAEDWVQLTMFKAGLRSKKFVVALAKSPPASMTDLLIKAQKSMNVEDALTTIEVGGPRSSKTSSQNDQKGQKRERRNHLPNNDRGKRRDDKARKMVNFTPLVMLIYQILMQITDDYQLRWLKPLSGSPNARNKKKYCRFHRDHEHYTDECKDLKEQIEELI